MRFYSFGGFEASFGRPDFPAFLFLQDFKKFSLGGVKNSQIGISKAWARRSTVSILIYFCLADSMFW